MQPIVQWLEGLGLGQYGEAFVQADIDMAVLPDLNDITLGKFEGRPIDEYRAWLREFGPEAPVPGGGESRVDVVARYARGFRTVLARAEPKRSPLAPRSMPCSTAG